jgi:hypothetical protein
LLHDSSQNQAFDAGWSSPVARQAHNLKVVGSNPTPATKLKTRHVKALAGFFMRETALFYPQLVDPPSVMKINGLSSRIIA